MSHQVSTSFPDSVYSESNKPSVVTLQGDIQNLTDAHNAHDADSVIHVADSSAIYTKTEVDALITSVKQALYPVGSYYANGAVSTNPATLLGFGTWIAVAGKGIMGLDAGQTEFASLLQTGGEKTHLLTGAESGEKGHNHTQDAHSHGSVAVKANNSDSFNSSPFAVVNQSFNGSTAATTATNQAVPASNASQAHNNLQPYEVAALWRRVS